jgi:hypothetical protein
MGKTSTEPISRKLKTKNLIAGIRGEREGFINTKLRSETTSTNVPGTNYVFGPKPDVRAGGVLISGEQCINALLDAQTAKQPLYTHRPDAERCPV